MSKPMTKKETADYLRITERTIDCYRAQKLIRAIKGRGKVLFTMEEIEGFLKKNKEK